MGLRILNFPLEDFIDQGIGLEIRSKKFKRFWEPHLNKSKEFILKSLSLAAKEQKITQILVLGAGRLNDFPFEQILAEEIQITLVDIDPSNISIWKQLKKKYPKQVDWLIADITGRFNGWTKLLRQPFLQTEEYLKLDPDLNRLFENKYDFVISLNLLSQLGVFWSDRVNKTRPSSPEVLSFIEQTCKFLEQEHLLLLQKLSIYGFCLIADEQFHYYLPDQSQWQTEKACVIDRTDELANFSKELESCWLWHLRPASSEGEKYGEIHRVLAHTYLAKS